jgi:hypothetical protein
MQDEAPLRCPLGARRHPGSIVLHSAVGSVFDILNLMEVDIL